MKIITWHGKPSEKCPSYGVIQPIAEQLRDFANDGPFIGNHTSCYALHHSQVDSTRPLNFFVLSFKGLEVMPAEIKSWIIMNPKITYKSEAHEEIPEGCMSFGFRQHKKKNRPTMIDVEFDTPNGHSHVSLIGLPARIFQHEVDHANGITIYD